MFMWIFQTTALASAPLTYHVENNPKFESRVGLYSPMGNRQKLFESTAVVGQPFRFASGVFDSLPNTDGNWGIKPKTEKREFSRTPNGDLFTFSYTEERKDHYIAAAAVQRKATPDARKYLSTSGDMGGLPDFMDAETRKRYPGPVYERHHERPVKFTVILEPVQSRVTQYMKPWDIHYATHSHWDNRQSELALHDRTQDADYVAGAPSQMTDISMAKGAFYLAVLDSQLPSAERRVWMPGHLDQVTGQQIPGQPHPSLTPAVNVPVVGAIIACVKKSRDVKATDSRDWRDWDFYLIQPGEPVASVSNIDKITNRFKLDARPTSLGDGSVELFNPKTGEKVGSAIQQVNRDEPQGWMWNMEADTKVMENNSWYLKNGYLLSVDRGKYADDPDAGKRYRTDEFGVMGLQKQSPDGQREYYSIDIATLNYRWSTITANLDEKSDEFRVQHDHLLEMVTPKKYPAWDDKKAKPDPEELALPLEGRYKISSGTGFRLKMVTQINPETGLGQDVVIDAAKDDAWRLSQRRLAPGEALPEGAPSPASVLFVVSRRENGAVEFIPQPAVYTEEYKSLREGTRP